MSCNNSGRNHYQVTSKIFIKNLKKRNLQRELKYFLNDTIYFYIVRTVNFEEDKFIQTGTGPNLEGNLITLCTCKHKMRTFPDIKKGTWIAGFTTRNAYIEDLRFKWNYLFYLFQIHDTLDNQHQYDSYLKENFKKTYNFKNSIKNDRGDLYIINKEKSVKSDNDYYEPEFYNSPCEQHGHFKNKKGESIWHKDINRVKVKYKGRIIENEHKLLIGDKDKSFVWEKPVLRYDDLLHRGQSKSTIENFLSKLK